MTDEAARQHEHTVLHFPIVHCELNPIELVLASVKSYVAKHNKDFNLKEVEGLAPDGFKYTTVDMWKGFCRHVVDVENEYIEKDEICEDTVEEIKIRHTAIFLTINISCHKNLLVKRSLLVVSLGSY